MMEESKWHQSDTMVQEVVGKIFGCDLIIDDTVTEIRVPRVVFNILTRDVKTFIEKHRR
jgi:hypothetical protein